MEEDDLMAAGRRPRSAAKPVARRRTAARSAAPPRAAWPLLVALGASAAAADGRLGTVPLDGKGFAEVSAEKSPPEMAAFVTRLLLHLGARPGEEDAVYVRNFSGMFAGAPESAYDSMLGFLLQRPEWAHFDTEPRCIADRQATREAVEKAAGDLCDSSAAREVGLNCSLVPKACSTDAYSLGDWVFGTYYRSLVGPRPLENCYFDGSAIYASSKLYAANTSSACLVPSATPKSSDAFDSSTGSAPGWTFLGSAESPGLQAAQTSGHGLPGVWWVWLLFAAVLLTCIGFGAHKSRKHIQHKAEKAEMRKRDWFKSKFSRRSLDKKQAAKRSAEVSEEALVAAEAAPVAAIEAPAAPLLPLGGVVSQATADPYITPNATTAWRTMVTPGAPSRHSLPLMTPASPAAAPPFHQYGHVPRWFAADR